MRCVLRGKDMKQRRNRNLRRKKRLLGILMIVMALLIMQLPGTEASAASSVYSFKMSGSTLVKYRGADKNVVIPDTVEVIGRGAFEDNTNIELVVLSNSVKRIDPYAFWGCDNLDTVVLGKGLTEVGDCAFAGCKGLEQMTIPSNVTEIGIQAFGDCVNMKDISIPPETVRIHETAFDGCVRLTIHAEEYSVAETYAEEFYKRQKEMAGYEDVAGGTSGSDETMPLQPTEEPVEESMLGSTQIVGNAAVFLMEGSLLPVYEGTPKSAQALADYMGEGRIPKYAIVDGAVVADQAYYRSSGLTNVSLPDGLREIGQFSFARSSTSSVVMPQGVERIDYGAFYHCESLAEVTLPDTVMCVEPKAFTYTPWVENFLAGRTGEGDFLTEGGVLVAYRGNFQNVVIPDGVRVIGAEVFQNHTEIKSVSLPDSLLVIGEGAFEGCSQLRRITFGKNVEEIKDRAFEGCSTLLGTISLPASVKKLGLQAFGSAIVKYDGEEPEHTYEVSASRLSNGNYRNLSDEGAQEPGVEIIGMEGASASLEEADRSYTLTIETLQESSEMEEGCRRIFQAPLPTNRMIYHLMLTDSSKIPLTKLGTQTLTVIMPVPETLSGQNLRLLTLDRNGQPENVAVERVLMDGVECFQFQIHHLSLFVLYGTGKAGTADQPMEVNVTVNNLSAPPDSNEDSVDIAVYSQGAVQEQDFWHSPAVWVGSALLFTGVILLLAGERSIATKQ